MDESYITELTFLANRLASGNATQAERDKAISLLLIFWMRIETVIDERHKALCLLCPWKKGIGRNHDEKDWKKIVMVGGKWLLIAIVALSVGSACALGGAEILKRLFGV